MKVRSPNKNRTLQNGVRNSGFGVQGPGFRVQGSGFSIPHSAFTLIELLVTITIIGILAGISLGAIRYARQAAVEAKTKNTIAKINALVMQKYESYMTRRVPIDFGSSIANKSLSVKQAALLRYCAVLDLMRMEMPERTFDITNGPLGLIQPTNPWTTRPALSQIYLQKYNKNLPVDNCRPAKYLYMWVSMTFPEAMSQFGENEIADIDHDGWPVFVDGWGNPIMFLRWAPGFSSGVGLNPNPFNPSNPGQPRVDASEIQTGDPVGDHDPFDSLRIFPGNYSYPGYPSYFRLIPLIYSAGPDQAGHDVKTDSKYGIVSEFFGSSKYYNIDFSKNPLVDTLENLNPYEPDSNGKLIGSVTTPTDPDPGINHFDNIHNHRIEQQ
jgi:prepilin-type N-terminal cleavage/methylation domain-containing protein